LMHIHSSSKSATFLMEWKSQRAQHTITLYKVLLLNETANDPADSTLPTSSMKKQVNVITLEKKKIQSRNVSSQTLYNELKIINTFFKIKR
jgi:hypothetical protein